MKFIKRLIFICILLLIAFFIYRLINPTAAQELLYDIKTFSNTNLHTHFSLNTGEILVETWIIFEIEETWGLQELTGDDELLFGGTEGIEENTGTWTISSAPCPAMSTVNSCPTDQEKYISYSSSACGTYYACRTKTTASITSNGLSSQDKIDVNNVLDNFEN